MVVSARIWKIIMVSGVFAGIFFLLLVMTAPGFVPGGSKLVELHYGKMLRLQGHYPTIWKMRVHSLEVLPAGGSDAIAADVPVAVEIGGGVYDVGTFDPQLIRTLGGSITKLPTIKPESDAHGGIQFPSGFIMCRFRDGRLVSWQLQSYPRSAGPLPVGISLRKGPPLQLPATEDKVRKAFGPPTDRIERIHSRRLQPFKPHIAPLRTSG